MEFQDVVRKRKMVRSFEDRPIPREVVDRILANAQRAPCALMRSASASSSDASCAIAVVWLAMPPVFSASGRLGRTVSMC